MKTGYVLVTPARNEGRYLTETIESVLAQTVLPRRWVIVSDGSTDDTESIASRYSLQHSIITLIRRSGDATRNYGSKVRAIWAGSEELCNTEYDFIGILDADVSFERNYYENVLKEFDRNPRLGIAGGITRERDGHGFSLQFGTTERCVPGPIQLFRRQCYEEIGGLRALRYGGEDTAAIEMARMQGWEVLAFRDLVVWHHRRVGTEGMGILRDGKCLHSGTWSFGITGASEPRAWEFCLRGSAMGWRITVLAIILFLKLENASGGWLNVLTC